MNYKIALSLFSIILSTMAFAQGITIGYNHSVSVKKLIVERPSDGGYSPVEMPLPAYPQKWLLSNIPDEVALRFLVKADGSVSEVQVLSSKLKEFEEAAKAAVLKWKFRLRSEKEGIPPIERWLRCRIIFRIEED